ncbi:MAG: amidase family protein [Rhodobacteraceae bacterium]|nr:amidase family protein [Paracoccaceae bacterium]
MTEIWQLSAAAIAEAVRGGDLSAVEVAQAHLDRQEAVNPSINAIVQSFPEEALAEARAIDAQRAAGHDPGPLAGVPVTTKVNVDQRGHATTNGLKLQRDLVAAQDNPVVANLRRAGAVIVGRTNTPAFSLRWFADNDLHGQTLNPHDAGRTPGGSSGGASAAVAAGLCAIGHGTDIAGSVRYPAYACGLQGLRPSLGRFAAFNPSGADRYIGAQLMAVSGPLARSIADIRLATLAMLPPDPMDPWVTPAPLDQGPHARRVALCPAPDDMPVDEPVLRALEAAAAALRDAGWDVTETKAPPMRAAARINATLWMAEMQMAAEKMVAAEDNANARFVFERMAEDAGPVTLDTLMAALQARVGLIREWETFLRDCPVVLCPTSGMLPFEQLQDVRSPADFATVFEAQLTQRALPTLGLPGLAVATGTEAGVPVGVQLIAGRFREDILLAAGHDIEAALGAPVVVTPAAR